MHPWNMLTYKGYINDILSIKTPCLKKDYLLEAGLADKDYI
jgi:hypothetical protein